MSRRRWIVLLGPPLLIAVATVPGLARGFEMHAGATALLPTRSITACPPVAASAPGAPSGQMAAVPGAWWRIEPSLDSAGSLEGWTLQVGGPGARTSELSLSPASTVTGPVDGRVVVASEEAQGGDGSAVRIVDAVRGCATLIPIMERVARRAVADPVDDGVLVHLLEPGTRRDLGVWRMSLDGRTEERVLEPTADVTLAAAGIDRVWATDLRVDGTGRRLAVQSCHPDACVTRIVDLATGDVAVLARAGQGPIVGFSGRQLVTWAACHGLPCPVLAWDMAGGSARTLALEASGAALSGDGRHLVVVRPRESGGSELAALDLSSGMDRSLRADGADSFPLSGAASASAGMEVVGASVAIGHAGRIPTPWTLDDNNASFTPPDREVQP